MYIITNICDFTEIPLSQIPYAFLNTPTPAERERRDGKETEIEERGRKRESSDTKYFIIQKTRSGSICYMQKQPPWLGKRVRYTDYNHRDYQCMEIVSNVKVISSYTF